MAGEGPRVGWTGNRKACAAVLFLIFLAAFSLKLYFVTREPLVYNNDAGYYVEHIGEVLKQGYPDVSDPPLAFYYAAAFAAFFGVMLGFKIAISLASAAIAFPAFSLADYLSGKKELALIAAFFAAFSPTNMYMMGDLLKNMAGLFFGAWFVYFALRASERFSWRDASLAAASAALMLGSHFSSGAYILLAVAPYLALRGGYDVLRGKAGAEAAFCLSIVGALFLAGIAIILTRGMVGGGGIVAIGIYGEPGINTAALDQYGLFLLPALLGISRLPRRQAALFAIWLAVTFLLTQPFFARPEWQMRFAWNAYMPVAVLSALGLGYFAGDRRVFAGAALLLGFFTMAGFAHSGTDISPIIYEDEWEGLLRLHAERPDIVFSGAHGGTAQWIEAAGFEAEDGPPQGYLLVCDSSVQPENRWYAGACAMTAGAPDDAVRKLPAIARFGRFYVVPAAAAGPESGVRMG